MAFSPATNCTHSYPRARASTSSKSRSPCPSSTGETAMCSSSIKPARRYCWMVFGPPPMRTSLPLAPPRRVGPGTANRPEHVSPQDPGAHVLEPSRSEFVIDARRAPFGAEQGPLDRARREQPLVKVCAAQAERIREVLPWTRSVTVERDGEALDPDACHGVGFPSIYDWWRDERPAAVASVSTLSQRGRSIPQSAVKPLVKVSKACRSGLGGARLRTVFPERSGEYRAPPPSR